MIRENEVISKVLLSIEQYKGNFKSFRNAVLVNDYNPKSKNFSRLLLWKSCLITETLNIQAWRSKLKTCRTIYHDLRKKPEMSVPWWALDSDDEFFIRVQKKTAHIPIEPQRSNRIRNVTDDPLTNELPEISPETHSEIRIEESKDIELLNTIILDVQRLFPGDQLFHGKHNNSLKHKRQLITILFIWSKSNSLVGYKQGLHEIIGLIYKNMFDESLEIPNTNTFSFEDLEILNLYDSNFLEHDLFFLFSKFVSSSGVVAEFYQSETLLIRSIEHFNGLLMKVDQLIHYNLITKLQLDTQLWIIRFFRLLLLRELGNNLEVPSSYWDKLAAAEASSLAGVQCIPELISFSVIILLIHLKAELALCDFAEALSLLLHYPISTRLHLYPNFIEALFEDAYNLYRLRENDLKLYEYGLKLNKKYASIIKFNTEYTKEDSPSKNLGAMDIGDNLLEIPNASDIKRKNMAFEKSRLEMRLKKKAQLILKK